MAKKSQKALKIAILGGGSYYTPSFVHSMCNMPDVFGGAELRLIDIDQKRISLIKPFCEMYTKAKGVAMTFVDQPDLDAALEGADFVITTFRIGGVKSLMMDETIPQRFGYYGNETAGPGGIFMAARTAPVVLDVARRMKKLCPKAWMLNYANPTNFITDALYRSGFTRSVGLCDGFICPPADIGVTLGIDWRKHKITTRHAGFNHCSWTYLATLDGRDLLKELRELTEAKLAKNLSSLTPENQVEWRRWREIFLLMGLYPCPDGHVMPYFYHEELAADQKANPDRHYTYLHEEKWQDWKTIEAVVADFSLEGAEKVTRVHAGGHADLAVGVAAAIATDSGEVFPANLPNDGTVSWLPDDAIIERYCKVTGKGFQSEKVPQFPQAIIAQQSHLVAVQRLAVDGVLERDRSKLLQAVSLLPSTTSIERARKLFDAMWQEEQGVLGDYWK